MLRIFGDMKEPILTVFQAHGDTVNNVTYWCFDVRPTETFNLLQMTGTAIQGCTTSP